MSAVKKTKEKDFEAEEGLTARSRDVYPDAVVKISRDQYSIFELKRMTEREPVELVLAPEFQRNKVWKREQQRELVESVLMNIPIPVVYVFENEEGRKQVVDGRQRIGTLISFLNNEFTLDKLKMLPRFNGKKFEDLEPVYQSRIERYQILVYVIEPPTPERVKYDIFDRVNRGGTQLNSQEMRNALYQGEATRLLKRMSQEECFQKATGFAISPKRMKDQYLILRFISFYMLQTSMLDFTYKSSIDDLLAEAMKHINALSRKNIQKLEEAFKKSMQTCFQVLGADGFRFAMKNSNRRPINMPLFETLAYFFAIADLEDVDVTKLAVRLEDLKESFDAGGYFSSRVDSSRSVEYRFGEIEKLAGRLREMS